MKRVHELIVAGLFFTRADPSSQRQQPDGDNDEGPSHTLIISRDLFMLFLHLKR